MDDKLFVGKNVFHKCLQVNESGAVACVNLNYCIPRFFDVCVDIN